MPLFSRSAAEKHTHEEHWAHALRRVPLLREIPAADLLAVWRCLSELRAAAGTVICERGVPGDRFFMIQQGTLEVRMGLGPAGVPIRRLGAGDFLGEMSLLTGAPRSADVVVVEDALLWVLERRDFDDLLNRRLSLLRALNRALCERVEHLTSLLEERALGGGGPAGLRFGPYRVVAQIGAGGMAAVYSAIHEQTQTAVAVKVLPAGWGDRPELRQRLQDEATALQRINHPSVIRVLAVGVVEARLGGGCYLALEWVPHALDRVMRAQYPEPLAVATALRVAQGVAEGLASLHDAGLVHRDVKPSNILLRADGTPVLTDLGLVTALHESGEHRRLTPTNMILGTADYISPEQITGTAVDGRCDLYALGVVLYEMLAGYPPFAGRAPLDALRAKIDQPAPPLPASVPPTARAVVERALQRDPANRFPSASAMAEALAGA